MSTVYCHKNLINQCKYVGITNVSLERRWKNRGEGYKGQLFYEKGILSFGWENFEHIALVENIPNDLAEQIEARIIKGMDLTNPEKGYNESTGAIIRKNHEADIIANQAINRLIETEKQITLDDFDFPSYSATSNKYSLDFLFNDKYKKNLINTDLDCQRDYVWDEARQQGLWDTLLRGHRIPEIHSISDGWRFDIADGKQRLLTIFKILNDEIPLKRKFAQGKVIEFLDFLGKKEIYFSELPKKFQIKILRIHLDVAEYFDMSEEDITILFQKLNSGKDLTTFYKGIASNILIRKNFTRYFIYSSAIKALDVDSEEEEKFLVRSLMLMHYGLGKIDLAPKEMLHYYKDFNHTILSQYKTKMNQVLEKLEYFLNLTQAKLRAKGSFYPILFYLIYEEKLSDKQLLKIFHKLDKLASIRGNDLSKKNQLEYYNMLLALLNN